MMLSRTCRPAGQEHCRNYHCGGGEGRGEEEKGEGEEKKGEGEGEGEGDEEEIVRIEGEWGKKRG
jgi:hypothetical protein